MAVRGPGSDAYRRVRHTIPFMGEARSKAVLKVVTQVAVALVVASLVSGKASVWLLTGAVLGLASAGWIVAVAHGRRS